MNSVVVFSIALYFFASSSLDTTRSDSFYPISTIGSEPRFSFKEDKPFLFIHDESNRTWLFHKSGVWILEQDKTWSYFGKIEFEEDDLVGSYNAFKEEFWFWSRGVGKVYTWKPGMLSPVRIDKSDHHRTQFGHYGFIHPNNGNIYAFGGTGFWQDRSYILEFDQKAGEWNIVPLKNFDVHPEGRRNALGMFDPNAGELHILSGYGHQFERYDKGNNLRFFEDYWIFDFELGIWNNKPVYGGDPEGDYENFVPESNFISTTAFDSTNGLIWQLVSQKTNQKLRLFVYDIRREFGTYLPNTITTNNLRFVKYDQTTNRLILHELDFVNNQMDAGIKSYALDLPNAVETRRMMDSTRRSELFQTKHTYLLVLLVIITSSVGFIFVYRKINRNSKNDTESGSHVLPIFGHENQHKSDNVELLVRLDHSIQIWLNGREITSEFDSPEREILVWLLWKNKVGEKFQNTTSIEDLFWSTSPNPDYVRKQRNISLKRINDSLNVLFEQNLEHKPTLISRNSYNDKRKKEYALDLGSITCSIDIRPEFMLQQKPWVQNITSDFTK